MIKKFIVLTLVMGIVLSGCQEVQSPEATEEKETALVENVDLSAIQTPQEVCVYQGHFLDDKPEEKASVFLGSDFQEGETSADGRKFLTASGTEEERMVIVEDGGMSFFGESGHAVDSGIIFSGREEYVKACRDNEDVNRLQDEYYDTGKVSGNEPDQEDDKFLSVKAKTENYLEQLKMRGYVLDGAAVLDLKSSDKKTGYFMFWRQMIDEIPVSDILLENSGNKTVYNYRYQICNPELLACSSTVEVIYAGDELAEWYNYGMICEENEIKKCPVVSAEKACEKIKERYPAESATGEAPVLERVQLQYEILKLDGKLYIYPIWLFGVKESDGGWWYYLMDAVTGDFFRDIPEEFQR